MAVMEITDTEQYLTFKLDEETFAVDVSKVREILEYTPITRVPRTPDFMRGVINVRGSVVPVMDLRVKFKMSKTEQSVDTCIIVLEMACEDGVIVLGALADSVQEVIELDPGQIEPTPHIGSRIRTEFIKGMGKRDGSFIMILDIDKVFTLEDLTERVSGTGVEMQAEAV